MHRLSEAPSVSHRQYSIRVWKSVCAGSGWSRIRPVSTAEGASRQEHASFKHKQIPGDAGDRHRWSHPRNEAFWLALEKDFKKCICTGD